MFHRFIWLLFVAQRMNRVISYCFFKRLICRRSSKKTQGADFTNILRAAFSYKKCRTKLFFLLRFKVCIFLAQKYWRKSRAYNVEEIDSRCLWYFDWKDKNTFQGYLWYGNLVQHLQIFFVRTEIIIFFVFYQSLKQSLTIKIITSHLNSLRESI